MFSPKFCFFSNFFLKKNFFQEIFFDFFVQKSFLTKIFFNVTEMKLTSGVHCILVLFLAGPPPIPSKDTIDAPYKRVQYEYSQSNYCISSMDVAAFARYLASLQRLLLEGDTYQRATSIFKFRLRERKASFSEQKHGDQVFQPMGNLQISTEGCLRE